MKVAENTWRIKADPFWRLLAELIPEDTEAGPSTDPATANIHALTKNVGDTK